MCLPTYLHLSFTLVQLWSRTSTRGQCRVEFATTKMATLEAVVIMCLLGESLSLCPGEVTSYHVVSYQLAKPLLRKFCHCWNVSLKLSATLPPMISDGTARIRLFRPYPKAFRKSAQIRTKLLVRTEGSICSCISNVEHELAIRVTVENATALFN